MRMTRDFFLLLPLLAAVSGCPTADKADSGASDSGASDSGDSGTGDSGDTGLSQDWCGVQSIFNRSCVSGCHDNSNPAGDLDLQTDPYTALVSATSPEYPPAVLVTPGDSASSLLYLKVSGTQSSSQGNEMPAAGLRPADEIQLIKDWIDAGASSECTGPVDTNTERHHPEGWDDPEAHGPAAKCQEETCTECHGADLTGDVGPSCDSCHASGWRTDCTYCHGGTDNPSGAPPVDNDGSTTGISFPEHTQHVEQTIHAAWDCNQCHTKPTDVLSAGHVFVGDTTDCTAEVLFSGGLSSRGSYGGSGSCSNLYCHSNGRSTSSTGTATSGRTLDCSGCHGAWSNRGSGLSGEHGEHIGEGVHCYECHSATISDDTTVSNPANHVDGEKDVQLPDGMTYTSGSNTCTGTCHGERHSSRNW